jgi:MFS family permease
MSTPSSSPPATPSDSSPAGQIGSSSSAPEPAKPRIPRAVWALGFVSLLMDVSSEMIHALLPVFLVTTLAASAFVVGLIEGTAEATALIVKVFSGALSDYWGRRKPLALLGYGLAALSKPLFALATTAGLVFTARIADRIGKGIRGAPRDALLADIAPPSLRGAAFGLRQSLDTVGAFLGPVIAIGLMLLWANDFRAVFWVAIVPALLSVATLLFGVQEPDRTDGAPAVNPIRRENLRRLPSAYWSVVAVAAIFTLARFSEAFLLLRAQEGGLALAWVPMVLIAMNIVYSLSAYPFGSLADRMSPAVLLALGLGVLIVADLLLAWSARGVVLWGGIALWGLHMGMTQGLLSALVARTAPSDLRGTAFGLFNLVSGVAMLIASALAGLLWDGFGASFTFIAGAGFSAITLLVMAVTARRIPATST